MAGKKSGSSLRGTMAERFITPLIMPLVCTGLGSMEDTLLVGGHIVGDKLAYAEPGPIGKYLLPYSTPHPGNRGNSLDSRYWGFVPRENIIGKPVLVFWSYDAPAAELMPGSDGYLGRHIHGYASEQHLN